MSLPVLVALVAVGITLMVFAVHWTGGSRLAVIADEAQAQARFADDHPDDRVEAVHITADRADAFLLLADGRVGIVHRVGDMFLTRTVSAADGLHPEVKGASLGLAFDDFTWRGGTFVFRSESEARGIAQMLSAADGNDRKAA